MMVRRVRCRAMVAAAAAAAAGALVLLWSWRCGCFACGSLSAQRARETGAPVPGRELPLVFVGGVPRSGTTLMRAMLDAHPLMRCGQETRLVPRILELRQHWLASPEMALLLHTGISKQVLDNALAAFCLELIVRHAEPAPRYCNKDPLVLKFGSYVLELFPNARFLFVVRDGRATVHSIIARQITFKGFSLRSYRQSMKMWNHFVKVMYKECQTIGTDKCLLVHYERLVLRPREQMRRVLRFLDLPWSEATLHHERYVGRPNGVALSKLERSSEQVVRPVNLEALHRWVGGLPRRLVAEMGDVAPMLAVLGYDPWANPPHYGDPDPEAHSGNLSSGARTWPLTTSGALPGKQ